MPQCVIAFMVCILSLLELKVVDDRCIPSGFVMELDLDGNISFEGILGVCCSKLSASQRSNQLIESRSEPAFPSRGQHLFQEISIYRSRLFQVMVFKGSSIAVRK
jgi:hypothetical protein